jgi:hypothetical protein
MSLYAENTKVPVTQSRGEIERLLGKHKCTQFSTGVDHEQHRAVVQFKAHNRIIRFEIALPDEADKKYRQDRHGWARTPGGITNAVEQASRQRWRALLLVIKAKLEAVENNIATFEEEFLAHIVLPNQQTVAAYVQPLIERAYQTGRMPTDRLLNAGDVVTERVED